MLQNFVLETQTWCSQNKICFPSIFSSCWTEISAIPVISQLPFPWLAVVTEMTKAIPDSSPGAARASMVPCLWQGSCVNCPGTSEPRIPRPADSSCHPPSGQLARWLQKCWQLILKTSSHKQLTSQADTLVTCSSDKLGSQKRTWDKHLRSYCEISALLFYFSILSSVAMMIISRPVRYCN